MNTSYFRIGDQVFKSDKRKKIETVDAGGSGLEYGTKLFKAKQIEAVVGDYFGGEVETVLFEKEGKVYERVGFDHCNGHFSGYTKGVYQIRFRQLVAKTAL